MADHESARRANETAFPTDPELAGNLKGYDFDARVEWLRKHSRAGFIATSHAEINDAFAALLDYDTQGQTFDGRLAQIAQHARNTASQGDEELRAQRTAIRITKNHIAYAEQAAYDTRNLRLLRNQVEQSIYNAEQYGSMAEYVASSGTPVYQGPGQLTRYLAAALQVNHNPLANSQLIFRGRLAKDHSGRSVIRDEFTAKDQLPVMWEYGNTILSVVPMDQAVQLIGLAAENEVRRQRFWEHDLFAATQNDITQPIALAALRNLSA